MTTQEGLVRTHWGVYRATGDGKRLTAIDGFADDPHPSDIGRSLLDAGEHKTRIRQPHVRRGWLERGPGARTAERGRDDFVPVEWDRALDLVAAELARVTGTYGNEALFGGSYGWASAGRFHHAQSQAHRFFNTIGGYVAHKWSYSAGAAHVIMPHVLGYQFHTILQEHSPSWPVVAKHAQLVVMFGGLDTKNNQVTAGGSGRHEVRHWLARCREAGTRFVNVSPLATDAWQGLEAEWLPVRPCADTAMMLGLAYVLESEGLLDRDFLARYATGYERFRAYLLGESDGQPKSPEWAAPLCGIEARTIADLARRMAGTRCLITIAWSLQRAENGEQPFWMATVLAAMIGQIGLPGGGIAYGFGSMGGLGGTARRVSGLTLPQGRNPVERFIPVARIADMLLEPGGVYRYNGKTLTYPDIRLVYWCGGNPFHHHQDLNRLRRAWNKPETIVVHEPWWTATARHADIVLPANTPLERNDIGRTTGDPYVVAMKAMVAPVGQSRSDFAIFADLAERLQVAGPFTEGRDEMGWLRHLYADFRQGLEKQGIDIPEFEGFWEEGLVRLDIESPEHAVNGFDAFRADPIANPLPTPSGLIEVFSETIADFGAAPCTGHPLWIEPQEWLGGEASRRFPLHLLSPQPAGKLHSQLDFGRTSVSGKRDGREVVAIHPRTAAARGIAEGDTVRIFNDRGACLAVAGLSEDILETVVSLPTGAWFDPDADNAGLERHGNPNVLTRDRGTSEIAQGCAAHSALVEVERFQGAAPTVMAFEPPGGA